MNIREQAQDWATQEWTRIMREAAAAVRRKMAAEQKGEAFRGAQAA